MDHVGSCQARTIEHCTAAARRRHTREAFSDPHHNSSRSLDLVLQPPLHRLTGICAHRLVHCPQRSHFSLHTQAPARSMLMATTSLSAPKSRSQVNCRHSTCATGCSLISSGCGHQCKQLSNNERLTMMMLSIHMGIVFTMSTVAARRRADLLISDTILAALVHSWWFQKSTRLHAHVCTRLQRPWPGQAMADVISNLAT